MPYQVKNFMSKPFAFVTLNDSLNTALDRMNKLKTKKLTVIDENNLIWAFISKAELCSFLEKEKHTKKINTPKVYQLLKTKHYFINAYPQNDIYEALNIMEKFDLNYLPVCKSIWEKELVGFINASDFKNYTYNEKS